MQSPPRTETRVSAPATMADSDGVASRHVALDALARIDDDGAYANLVLSGVLDRPAPSGAPLSSIDKGFVTDLVYGTVRMQRALDFLVDRFLTSDPPPAARMGSITFVMPHQVPCTLMRHSRSQCFG